MSERSSNASSTSASLGLAVEGDHVDRCQGSDGTRASRACWSRFSARRRWWPRSVRGREAGALARAVRWAPDVGAAELGGESRVRDRAVRRCDEERRPSRPAAAPHVASTRWIRASRRARPPGFLPRCAASQTSRPCSCVHVERGAAGSAVRTARRAPTRPAGSRRAARCRASLAGGALVQSSTKRQRPCRSPRMTARFVTRLVP